MYRTIFAVLTLFASGLIHAQQPYYSGTDGEFARDLLQAHQQTVRQVDSQEGGGREGAGQVRYGDVVFDVGEILPGATQQGMQQMRNTSGDDVKALEQQGIDQFNRNARAEGAQGEAARAIMDSANLPRGQYAVDPSWAMTNGTARDVLGESFADCRTTVDVQRGEPVPTKMTRSASCTVGHGENMTRHACERRWVFSTQLNPRDAFPDDPLNARCPGGWKAFGTDSCSEVQVTAHFEGSDRCDLEAAGGACEQEWQCTAEGPFEIEGHTIGAAELAAFGVTPLFPGAPSMCIAARARTTCPVCIEDDRGGQHSCTMVDVDDAEGSTCAALERSGVCREVGTQCILRDDVTGRCTLTSKQYSCEETVLMPRTMVMQGNSCNASIQCVDGSCTEPLEEEGEYMPIQEAMARMVVAETMVTDMSYDAVALANHDGTGQLTAEQQHAIDQVRMFKGDAWSCQKGYAGLVDCCGKTNTDAEALYWSIYQRVSRDRQAAEGAAQGGTSGFREWSQGGAGYDSLSNPFTSMRDNVMGGSNRTVDAVTMSIWDEFLARAREEIKPALSPSWICKDEEFDLAIQREVDMCSYAGTYCSQRVLGACLKRRESYCCYKSPMSKALRASAEPGGQLQHGSASSPDCDGLPIDQIDRVDWNAINFNGLIANMSEGGVFDRANDPENAMSGFTGSGSSGSMGGAQRQSVDVRTSERLSGVDFGGTRGSIAADVMTRDYRESGELDRGDPRLSFSAGSEIGYAGRPITLKVNRVGQNGPAMATVTLVSGSPDVAGFWQETLTWGGGDTSYRTVTLMPPRGVSGRVTLELSSDFSYTTIEGHRIVEVEIRTP
ncbi:conjugal transfer protein TraN [Luteimonas sp. MHLX1A]|nr:conjugal transfer protein TraN [Luteimonas sp. MHLX1A]